MVMWPHLKSGATAQLPVSQATGRNYTEVEFWGGGRQAYQQESSPQREWLLHYRGLSEDEVTVFLTFCEEHAQSQSYFVFEDPMNGQTAEHCLVIPGTFVARMSNSAVGEVRVGIRSVKD